LYGNFSIEADLNHHFVRYEDPLWDESLIEGKDLIYRVYKKNINKKCFFDVSINNKTIYIIDCSKLTKKQKTFVQSVEGLKFIIEQLKKGVKSFNKLKCVIKKK